ncbi:hypothetical protein [Priestia megaterium]|jgi:hypothetical protein|nr:hypothetical protein [Priestia megaterium]
MLKEYKQVFSDFIDEDRFELHSYLTYLFNQSPDKDLIQLEDEHIT